MKKILSTLAILALLFTSCKKETEAEETTTETVDSTAVDSASTDVAAQTIQPVQPNATGANPNSVMYSQPSSATYVQNAPGQVQQSTAKGMNPAHGQPGHRCDIAVGAPLNSPPGKVTAPKTIQTQPATTTTTMTATPKAASQTPVMMTNPNGSTSATSTGTVTAPGMNPPHGQEGHVCSVAVGAPLPK